MMIRMLKKFLWATFVTISFVQNHNNSSAHFLLKETSTTVKLPKAFLQAMKENILADTRYKDFKPSGGAQDKSNSKIPVLKGKLSNSKTTTHSKLSKPSEASIPYSENTPQNGTNINLETSTQPQKAETERNFNESITTTQKDLNVDKSPEIVVEHHIVDINSKSPKKCDKNGVPATVSNNKNQKKNENSTESTSKDSSSKNIKNKKPSVDMIGSNVTLKPSLAILHQKGKNDAEQELHNNIDDNTDCVRQHVLVSTDLKNEEKNSNININHDKDTIYCSSITNCPCPINNTTENETNNPQQPLVLVHKTKATTTKQYFPSQEKADSGSTTNGKKSSPKGSCVVVDFKNLTKIDQDNKKISSTVTPSIQSKSDGVVCNVLSSKTSNSNGNIHRTSSFSLLNTKFLMAKNIEEPSIEAQHVSDENETSVKLSRLAVNVDDHEGSDNRLLLGKQHDSPSIACGETFVDADSVDIVKHVNHTVMDNGSSTSLGDKPLHQSVALENVNNSKTLAAAEDQNKIVKQSFEIEKPKILPKTPTSTTAAVINFDVDNDDDFADKDYFDSMSVTATHSATRHYKSEPLLLPLPGDDKHQLFPDAGEEAEKEKDYFDHIIVDTIYSDGKILDGVHSSGYLSQTTTKSNEAAVTVNQDDRGHRHEPVILGAKQDKRHTNEKLSLQQQQRQSTSLDIEYRSGNPPKSSTLVLTDELPIPSILYPRNNSLPPKYLPPTPSSSSTPPTAIKSNEPQQGGGVTDSKPARESRTVFNVLSNIVDDLKFRIQSKKSLRSAVRHHGSSVDLTSVDKSFNGSGGGGGSVVSTKKKKRIYRSLSMDCLDINGEIGVVRSSSTSNSKHFHHDFTSPQSDLSQKQQQNHHHHSKTAFKNDTFYNKNSKNRHPPVILAENSDDNDEDHYGKTDTSVIVSGDKYIVEKTKTICYLEDPYNNDDGDADDEEPRVYDDVQQRNAAALAASAGVIQDSFEEIEVGPRFRDRQPSNGSLDSSSYTPPLLLPLRTITNNDAEEVTVKTKELPKRSKSSLAESFIKRKNSASSYFFSNKKDKTEKTAATNNGAAGGGAKNKKSPSRNSSPSSAKSSSKTSANRYSTKKDGSSIVDSLPSSKKPLKSSKRGSPHNNQQRFDDIRTTANLEDNTADSVTAGGTEEPALVVPQPPSSRRRSAKMDGRSVCLSIAIVISSLYVVNYSIIL